MLLTTNCISGYGAGIRSSAEESFRVTTASQGQTAETSGTSPPETGGLPKEAVENTTEPKAVKSEAEVKPEADHKHKDATTPEADSEEADKEETKPDMTKSEKTGIDPKANPEEKTVPDQSGEIKAKDPQSEHKEKRTLRFKDGKVEVTATFDDAAGLPMDTELRISHLEEDSKEYQKYYEQTTRWVQEKYSQKNEGSKKEEAAEKHEADQKEGSVPKEQVRLQKLELVDISFVANGQTIEPKTEVDISLNLVKTDFDKKDQIVVLHHDTEKNTAELPKSQDAEVTTDGEVKVEFTNGSFSPYSVAALYRAPYGSYDVVFDGTLGTSKAVSLVSGADYVIKQTDGSGRIQVPSQSGTYNPKYVLRGWINIDTKDYYPIGATATVNRNTVFYADWVQRSYDAKTSNANYIGHQPDTKSFIRTDVFDYNELFNLHHGVTGTVSRDAFTPDYYNGNRDKVSATWAETSPTTAFLFSNWYNFDVKRGSLGFPDNMTAKRNQYTSDNGGYNIVQGLLTGHHDTLTKDLFSPSDDPRMGRTYLGTGDNLFRFDADGTHNKRLFNNQNLKGYYYYDSDYYGADFQKSEHRFYIRTAEQSIRKQGRTNSGWNNENLVDSFMPFENSSPIEEKTGQTNYWFGMKNEIDFFLPNDVGSGGNLDIHQQPMKFYFSGDDDVWVFVDDVKVLDLGGIHGRVAGEVDFSSGKISYAVDGGNSAAGITLPSDDWNTLKKIKSGKHKLTIYYLERGSSLSNCAIYFNLAPRYRLDLTKKDRHQNTLLPNAEFSVYSDPDCTVPAMLYTTDTSKDATNVFKTNQSGQVSMYGLYAGHTYYITESKSPSGYPELKDKVIKLTLDATGNAKLENVDKDFAVLENSRESSRIRLLVKNEKPQKTSVEVRKKWFNEDGSEISSGTPDSIQVQLWRRYTTAGGGSITPPPIPNPPLGYSVPIRFTGQYFTAGDAHGFNQDTGWLTQGDLSKSMVVEAGSKLRFTLDVRKKNYNYNNGQSYEAGIYAVSVNGRSLRPIQTPTLLTEMNCYIGGSWNVFPPRQAVYEIDNIKTALDIKITLIGYLNYKTEGYQAVPSLKETLNIATTVVLPQQPEGGGTGTPDPPETVAEKVGSVETLSAGNNWHKKWDNLPIQTSNGEKYYYYVEERPVDGYSTSYSPQEVTNGLITISNVRLRVIAVKKLWQNFDGTVLTNGIPGSISGTLIQENKTTGQTKEISFTLEAAKQWRKQWRSDSAELGEVKGQTYVYRVKESPLAGFTVEYENTGVSEGEIRIINKKQSLKIQILKVSESGARLRKAKFSLYSNRAGTGQYLVKAYTNSGLTGQKTSEFETDVNGQITIYGLSPGTYYMREIVAPSGYLLLTDLIPITLKEDGSIELPGTTVNGLISRTPAINYGLTVKNRPTELKLIKSSTTDDSKRLAGAAFSIYMDFGCTRIVEAYTTADLKGVKKTEFETDRNGQITIYGLPSGTYYIKEIRAPDGYYLLDKVFIIRIKPDGTVSLVGESQTDTTHISLSGKTLTIKDHPIFDLPSSGSFGTHIFTFGGMSIFLSALFLWWNERRRGRGRDKPAAARLEQAGNSKIGEIIHEVQRRMIMKKFRKIFVAMLSLCLMLSLAGMKSLAASEADRAEIKITGFGDKKPTVKLYQIWKGVYEGTSFKDWQKATGTENLYKTTDQHPTSTDINKIAQGLQASPATVTAFQLPSGVSDTGTVANGEFKASVPAGVYIAVITPEAGNTSTYNPVLLTATYNENGLKAGSVEVTSKYLHGDTGVAKSSEPTVEKTATATTPDKNGQTPIQTGGVGDTVSYQVKPTLPQYPSNAINKTFYFSDTMSEGLTFQYKSLGIKLENVAEAIKPNTQGEFMHNGKKIATVKQVGNGFNLSFVYDEVKDKKPELVYQAIINSAAVVGSTGNKNKVEMFYTNNPNTGNTYDNVEEKPQEGNGIVKKEDEEVVYTYQISFKKVDDKNQKALAGAVFGIYSDEACKNLVDTVTTNEKGWASSSQVGKGTYYLKEIKAPNGYSLSSTVTKVDAQWTTVKTKKSAQETIIRYTSNEAEAQKPLVQDGWLKDNIHYSADPGNGAKKAYVLEKVTKSTSSESTITNTEGYAPGNEAGGGVVVGQDIVNTKIPELPSTGGMGTYLFTAVGVAVIALATGLLLIRRRNRA